MFVRAVLHKLNNCNISMDMCQLLQVKNCLYDERVISMKKN